MSRLQTNRREAKYESLKKQKTNNRQRQEERETKLT